VTVTEVPNVAQAIETVESHLHPKPSFDLADHPVPTGREEVWRFTPLRRIKALLEAAPDTGVLTVAINAPEGVEVGELAARQSPRGTVLVPGDRLAALADSDVASARYVRIPADLELTEPVFIDLHGEDAQGRANLVTVLVAEPHSKATVVLRHTGSAQVLENVEIDVRPGASLTVVSLQDWADDTLHGGEHTARVGRDASYRHVNVSFGGNVTRLHTNVYYEGPGGRAELYGVYFADAGQHIEHRMFVDHNAPDTYSHVDYRGALQGQDAHTVWVGDVLIRKIAENIETYETNKNLVLTEGARADSVPNLEIETGEIIGAGHSSTTGRFDDEQLFYLTSRGIDPDEAKRLVVMGFFVEIIRRIGIDDLEERLIAEVERELAETVGTAKHVQEAE
jgi:Fe-S cluster assembly protein SufD